MSITFFLWFTREIDLCKDPAIVLYERKEKKEGQ